MKVKAAIRRVEDAIDKGDYLQAQGLVETV